MLKTSQRLVNNNSLTWQYVFKMSWRCLQDVFVRRLEDVLKTSCRRMDNTNILVLTKMSSEDIWLIRIYSSSSRRLEDVFIRTNVCLEYLDEVIFSGSLPFSGVALLNWFTKSSKFEEGFNNNELSWSFSRSFHCVMLLSVLVPLTVILWNQYQFYITSSSSVYWFS